MLAICVKCLERYDASHTAWKAANDGHGRTPNFISTVPSHLFPSADAGTANNAATALGLADAAAVTALASKK